MSTSRSASLVAPAVAAATKLTNAFTPYPNFDTYTVALLLENERAAHERLIEAAIKARFQLSGPKVRELAGDLTRYPAWPDPADGVSINLKAIDWTQLARDWNETAREIHGVTIDSALSGKMALVVPVLESAKIYAAKEKHAGWVVELENKKLHPDVYAAVNQVLEGLGGKWHRQLGGHLFPVDLPPHEGIENVIETGTFSKPDNLGYFPTPESLAEAVVAKAGIGRGMRVLEPSIGQGHLANAAIRSCPDIMLLGYEINPRNAAVIAHEHQVVLGNFLDVDPEPFYDRVVMNPPFEKGQEIDHVAHAYDFLRAGGRLVAIMSASIQFRSDQRYAGLRTALAVLGGQIENNPENAFRASGTDVRTVTITVNREPDLDIKSLMAAAARGEVTPDTTQEEARAVLRSIKAQLVILQELELGRKSAASPY